MHLEPLALGGCWRDERGTTRLESAAQSGSEGGRGGGGGLQVGKLRPGRGTASQVRASLLWSPSGSIRMDVSEPSSRDSTRFPLSLRPPQDSDPLSQPAETVPSLQGRKLRSRRGSWSGGAS